MSLSFDIWPCFGHRATGTVLRETSDVTLDPALVAAAARRDSHHAHPDHIATLVQQTDTASHLIDGSFSGTTTILDAFHGAWLGVGVSDALDGELVCVDGVIWRVPDTGIPEVADPLATIPFAVAAARAPAELVTYETVPSGMNMSDLGELVGSETHQMIVLRIEGTFRDVVLRSEHRQTPPYRDLDAVLSTDEVRWHFAEWSGVMVGHQFPTAQDGVLIPGIHLHGISSDHLSGGHVREMTVIDAELSWAPADVEVTLSDDGEAVASLDNHQPDQKGMNG